MKSRMAGAQISKFVVVPDGLEPIPEPALPLPAAPYRRSLEYALSRATAAKGVIYLAPANRFGYQITEQEAARKYLIDNDFSESSIICCPSIGDYYLDTRENAFRLRGYLEGTGQWPLGDVCLVATAIHSKRANFWFVEAGFSVVEMVGIGYVPARNDLFVPRLWYYKFPLVHRTYEKLALWRDTFRRT